MTYIHPQRLRAARGGLIEQPLLRCSSEEDTKNEYYKGANNGCSPRILFLILRRKTKSHGKGKDEHFHSGLK